MMGARPVRGVYIRVLEPPGTPAVEILSKGLLPYVAQPNFEFENKPHPRASIYLLKSHGIGELSVTDRGRVELDYVPLRDLDESPNRMGMIVVVGVAVLLFSALCFFVSIYFVFGMFLGLVVAAAGLFFLYFVPPREREIREAIADLTGMAIDPAIIREDMARILWQRYADEQNAYARIDVQRAVRDATAMGIAQTAANHPLRRQVLLNLLFARLWLALGGDKNQYEQVTDQVLAALKAG